MADRLGNQPLEKPPLRHICATLSLFLCLNLDGLNVNRYFGTVEKVKETKKDSVTLAERSENTLTG